MPSDGSAGRQDSDGVRRAMKAWLSDDETTGSVTLRATDLTLVAQLHDGHRITWREITRVPFAGRPETTVSRHGGSVNIVSGQATVGSLIQAGDIGELNL